MKNLIVSPSSALSLRMGYLALTMLALVLLSQSAQGQTTYTWNSPATTAGSKTWSTTTDWTSTAPTGGPGASGSTTTDIADLHDANATGTGTLALNITYDSSASGFIGTLDLFNTVAGAGATVLTLNQNLTINQAFTQYQTGSGPVAQLALNGHNLIIASGALFTEGSPTVTPTTHQIMTTTGGGTIDIEGTMLVTEGPATGTTFSPGFGSTSQLISFLVDGTAEVQSTAATAGARMTVTGNFTAGNGSTLASLVTGTGIATNNSFFFDGATNTFGSGMTFTGFNSSGELEFVPETASQTTSTASLLPVFNVRDTIAGVSGTPATMTETFSSTATSGAISNAVNGISIQNVNFTNFVFQLGSNLNLVTGTPFSYLWNTSPAGESSVIDLHGFSYDATAGVTTTAFVGPTTVTGEQALINNTGASSIASNQGVFKAASFSLASGDTGIGSGVILQASGAGGTNNLGQVSGGSTTINSGSTFYYTGVGTASTLASGRSIGALLVGDGTHASTLKLASAITATGNVTSAASSTLDLNNNALALSGGANLVGGGTIASSTAGGTVAFATGGLTPGGGTTGLTTASLTFNSGTTTNLGVTGTTLSTSVFNIASGAAFDQILGSGTFNLNDATLTIDLLSGFSAPGTFNLFSNTSTLNGIFADASNVTLEGFNASLYTATFSGDTLTIATAVPEPSTWVMMFAGLGLLFFIQSRRRTSRE